MRLLCRQGALDQLCQALVVQNEGQGPELGMAEVALDLGLPGPPTGRNPSS